jgi:hypothetical protein
MVLCPLFGVQTFLPFLKFNQASFKQIAMVGYGKRFKHQALRPLERFQITPQLCITTRCTCMEDAKIAVTAMRTCTGSTLRLSDGSKSNSKDKFLYQEMNTLEIYIKTH